MIDEIDEIQDPIKLTNGIRMKMGLTSYIDINIPMMAIGLSNKSMINHLLDAYKQG
jgi:hypothetical protein